jgi:hypothetical protein
MITAKERADLVEKYRDERLYANAVAAKCAVCLALLTGIAVIGATVDTSGDSATARTAGVRNTVEECHRESGTDHGSTRDEPQNGLRPVGLSVRCGAGAQ